MLCEILGPMVSRGPALPLTVKPASGDNGLREIHMWTKIIILPKMKDNVAVTDDNSCSLYMEPDISQREV